MAAAEGRPLRRRLHARAPGPGARAGGLRPRRRAPRPHARSVPLRGGARRGARRPPPASRARARRRDLVPLHGADHPRHGRRGRLGVRLRRRDHARLGAPRELRASTRTRRPVLAALRAAGLRIGLVSNSARDVREFARHHDARRRRGDQLLPPRPHEAARLDLPRRARPARRRACRGRDGRRSGRRRHRGRPRIGMRAILLDRDGLHPEFEPRITGLHELLPQLGLQA